MIIRMLPHVSSVVQVHSSVTKQVKTVVYVHPGHTIVKQVNRYVRHVKQVNIPPLMPLRSAQVVKLVNTKTHRAPQHVLHVPLVVIR
jgi:hypothetical protein